MQKILFFYITTDYAPWCIKKSFKTPDKVKKHGNKTGIEAHQRRDGDHEPSGYTSLSKISP